jgi:thiol-disulfide isomerase/thioredoxin
MRVLGIGLAAIVTVALGAALTRSAPAARPAPPLPGKALAGEPITVASLRGEPTVIAFFASWCEPCVGEAPKLAEAARALGGYAHVVAVDWSDSSHYALALVRRYGWSFPVLSDPSGTAGSAYGIQGLPTAFVLNARGEIVERLLGPQTVSSLVRAVSGRGA